VRGLGVCQQELGVRRRRQRYDLRIVRLAQLFERGLDLLQLRDGLELGQAEQLEQQQRCKQRQLWQQQRSHRLGRYVVERKWF
jgi:hypothetical protein